MSTKTQSEKQAKRSAELSVLIRTAALKFDPKGGLDELASRAGVSTEALRVSIRRGYFTPGLASSLELVAGKKALPKEKLCPHKFKR